MTIPDPRTTQYNQRGDVWQHTYAHFPSLLPQPKRSEDHFDICDRLWYAAGMHERNDPKLAQLLRDALAKLSAYETLLATLQAKAAGTDGQTE